MTSTGRLERKSSISLPGTQNLDSSAFRRGGKSGNSKLSVQGDNTWKDVVRHEKLVIKLWDRKWDFLQQIPPPESHRESVNVKLALAARAKEKEEGKRLGLIPYQDFEKRNYHIKPSPPIPLKTSETIGWRSSIRENSLDLYPTICKVPKICFPDQQYGRYRKLKYLQEEENKAKLAESDKPAGIEMTATPFENNMAIIPKDTRNASLPSKFIRHEVNPLLC